MRTRRPHLDVLLGLQDVEDSLQAVLLRDLVEGVGHAAVELDQVRQGAVPQAGDALGSKSDDHDVQMNGHYLLGSRGTQLLLHELVEVEAASSCRILLGGYAGGGSLLG